MRIAGPLTAFVVMVSGPAYASGFTQSEGGYYVKAWSRSLIGDKAFDTGGELVDLPESFSDHALNFYGEYGLTREVTLLMNVVPFGYSSFGDTSTLYAGTLALGVRHALWTGSQPLAVEVRAGGRPSVGDDVLASGALDTGPYVVRATLPTLFFDVELQAAASMPYGMWVSAAAGARMHSREGLSPALMSSLQFGWSSSFGLVLDLHAQAYFSVQRPDVIDVLGVGQTDYIGLGVGAAYWITDGFGVTLGADTAPLARANAGTVPLQIGVQLKG